MLEASPLHPYEPKAAPTLFLRFVLLTATSSKWFLIVAGIPASFTLSFIASKDTYEVQLNTLLKSLNQKLKEDLPEKPVIASKTV
jgi:hypothetical protein